MFTLQIKTEGAAFCDPSTGEKDIHCMQDEVIRILKGLLETMEMGAEVGRVISYKNLHDINGNNVGMIRLRW